MSLIFDGTNDAGIATPPVTAYPFTYGAWIKRHASGVGSGESILSIGTTSSADHYHRIHILASNTYNCTSRDTGSSNSTSAGTITDTASWHLAGGVWLNDASRTAWLDAVAATTNTGIRTVTTPVQLKVGENPAGTDDYWGNMGHFFAYNTALGQADWDALYAGANPLTVQAANLVWYVPCLADDAPLALDVVGSLDLTLNSGVSDAQYDSDNPTVDAAPGASAAPQLYTVRSAIRLGS